MSNFYVNYVGGGLLLDLDYIAPKTQRELELGSRVRGTRRGVPLIATYCFLNASRPVIVGLFGMVMS